MVNLLTVFLLPEPSQSAGAAQQSSIYAELIKIIPDILWVLLAGGVIALFYKRIRDDLLPGLSSFKAMGVEFSFVRESIDAAIELAKKSPKWKVTVAEGDKKNVLNRARAHLKILQGAKILWVDDIAENNRNERRMFLRLNVDIDEAEDTATALKLVAAAKYDAIISDIARGNNNSAGLEMLKELQKKKSVPPVVFYIGVFDRSKGVPPGAFGITNRPDELLHLVIDVLERRKY